MVLSAVGLVMGNEVARVETETEDCTVVIFEDEDEVNSTPKDTYFVTKLNAVEVTGVPKGQAIKVGVVYDTDECGSQRFDLFRLRHLGTLTIQVRAVEFFS